MVFSASFPSAGWRFLSGPCFVLTISVLFSAPVPAETALSRPGAPGVSEQAVRSDFLFAAVGDDALGHQVAADRLRTRCQDGPVEVSSAEVRSAEALSGQPPCRSVTGERR